MAGVAGPMLRTSRQGGIALLAGLMTGEVAAAAVLTVPAFLLSEGVHTVAGPQARLWMLAVTCAFFGVADLANRTPQVRRQVPESLIGQLSPGSLGLAWGFDLGLLFTTQKAVSLIWVAIGAAILLDPAMTVVVMFTIALTGAAVVVVTSVARRAGTGRIGRWGRGVLLAKKGSGGVLLTLFAVTAVRAWHG